MSKPDWENFAKAVLADWPTGDLEGSVLFDLSLQYGMIQEVPGGYNSDRHFDNEGICPEEGDPWYEYTFRGEAGPGLYSIHALTEQLKTVLNREAATTARYDAKTDGLEAKLAECLERNALLEARLGKAVDALLLARVHVANNEQGWSVGRAAARSDLEIINATLAEIESSTPYGLKGEKG